jgi:hypothetical protein
MDLSGGAYLTTGQSTNNQTQTIGWEFKANVPITISALGMFDASQDGLLDAHEIGLWIKPITLEAGPNYVLGVFMLGIQGAGLLDPTPLTQDAFHGVDTSSNASLRSFEPQLTFINPRGSTQQAPVRGRGAAVRARGAARASRGGDPRCRLAHAAPRRAS